MEVHWRMEPKYKRILLKLSGEALAGSNKMGIDFDRVLEICASIKKCTDLGVEIGIVVGGGNFWRGRSSGQMDRTRADHMGMLATVINSLGIADGLEQVGVDVRVQTAISMQQIAEPYIRNRATRHLEKGRVVVFGCGTGNPFFSTDTAAALRAAEIEAQIVFKATNVDGVYDCDPRKNPNAKKYDKFMVERSSVKDADTGLNLHPIHIYNKNYYLKARPGDTFRSIGKEVGISYKKIAKYNERDKDDKLVPGEIIYLKKKQKKAEKTYKRRPHRVKAGESMYSIAQYYGIRLSSLYKMNDLGPDYSIQVGDLLKVR